MLEEILGAIIMGIFHLIKMIVGAIAEFIHNTIVEHTANKLAEHTANKLAEHTTGTITKHAANTFTENTGKFLLDSTTINVHTTSTKALPFPLTQENAPAVGHLSNNPPLSLHDTMPTLEEELGKEAIQPKLGIPGTVTTDNVNVPLHDSIPKPRLLGKEATYPKLDGSNSKATTNFPPPKHELSSPSNSSNSSGSPNVEFENTIVFVASIATIVQCLIVVRERWEKTRGTSQIRSSTSPAIDVKSIKLLMDDGTDVSFNTWVDANVLKRYIDAFLQSSDSPKPSSALFLLTNRSQVKVDVSKGATNNAQLEAILDALKITPNTPERLTREKVGIQTVKALFLAANPASTNRLAIDEEMRAIEQKVRAAKHRDALVFQSNWAVQPDDLLQLLNQYRPQIVHFSGHGSHIGLYLAGTDGQIKLVTTQALAALFKTLRDNIRLVFLSACYSREQAQALVKTIDCVVGMKESIHDDAATVFASSFYRAIGFGLSIQAAFDQGRTALLLEGIPEEDIPELLIRDGIDPNQVILIEYAANPS
jgi:CHAT domain